MNKIPVFHSYGKWELSGVNTWSVNIASASKETHYEHTMLFTGIPMQPQPELDRLGIRYEFLNLPEKRSRKAEWTEFKRFLEARAPCIYIPNYDFHRSCAIGTLSPEVRVCCVIHSDENCYFDELKRVGKNCDAIVAVSSFLEHEVKRRFPDLADRVVHIPHGIPLNAGNENGQRHPVVYGLRLAYCNRLQQYQKRIFDLPLILAELKCLGVPFHLTVAGDGPDREELKSRFDKAGVSQYVTMLGRVSNDKVIDLLQKSHAFLLTSDFEGLPISLLEAMAVGCVPVVYNIKSGIGDAVVNNQNGLIVGHGNTILFGAALKYLYENKQALEDLSGGAFITVTIKFSLANMVTQYGEIFAGIMCHRGISFRGRSGCVCPPRELKFGTKVKSYINRLILGK